jgi:hypothetical protein
VTAFKISPLVGLFEFQISINENQQVFTAIAGVGFVSFLHRNTVQSDNK